MKPKLSLAVLLLLSLKLCAQPYSIGWYKIAGGGGTSTGGVYSVSGTIGQADASGAMSGGQYSVTGGFWALISVVQTPGTPTLTITHSGNQVIISWPSPSTGFVLQQNPDLTTANWTASPGVSDNGTVKSLTLTTPTGNLFFRLAQ